MTKKQENDIEICRYFIPDIIKHIPITKQDIQMFLEWSEQGKHKDKTGTWAILPKELQNGFNALIEGKQWRGIHMQMYEDGVLDGTMPYFTLLGGYDTTLKIKWWQFWKPKFTHVHKPIPRNVVEYMKKEMFKGHDADLIEKVYQ